MAQTSAPGSSDPADIIRPAIECGKRLGLTLGETASMLGYNNPALVHWQTLERDLVVEHKGRDVLNRSIFAASIYGDVNRRFGDKAGAMNNWLNARLGDFMNKPVREVLAYGTVDDLRSLLSILHRMPM